MCGNQRNWPTDRMYIRQHSHDVNCMGPTRKCSQQGIEEMPKPRANAKYKNSSGCTIHANVHDYSSVSVNNVPCICSLRLIRATSADHECLVCCCRFVTRIQPYKLRSSKALAMLGTALKTTWPAAENERPKATMGQSAPCDAAGDAEDRKTRLSRPFTNNSRMLIVRRDMERETSPPYQLHV